MNDLVKAYLEAWAVPDDNFNKYCERLLVQHKRRNTKAVMRHLKGLSDILRHEDNHVLQTKFGGSVRKGTYVTGLSDVDILLIVNQSSLKNQPPSKVIAYVWDTIKRRLPKNPVRKGKLAVTVGYADKTEIQILPAIRTTDGFRIAELGSTKWSNVVHPERFAERLIKVNNAKGGRVVPVIKLAKAVADCFIPQEDRRFSGYHMETLAIDAFAAYQGELDPRAMLNRLFIYSTKAVLTPIKDSTGQSRYADEYLGPSNSGPRRRASTYFGQMRGKVDSCDTREAFDALFCVAN